MSADASSIDPADDERVEGRSGARPRSSTTPKVDGAGGVGPDAWSYDAWAGIYDRLWDHRLFDRAFRRLVLRDLPPPARLLDVGCGTGHQARRLADAGYQVTGLDVSARMLDHARARAPDCDFVLADARDFELGTPPPFDVAYSFYDTVNHILNVDGLLSAFRCVRAVLRPGGAFIFDLNTEEAFRGRWQETVTIVEDDLVLVGEGDYDPEARLGDYRITALVREGDPVAWDSGAPVLEAARDADERWVRRDAGVRERCHRQDEVTNALGRAGFSDIFQTSAEDAGMERSLHRVFYVAR